MAKGPPDTLYLGGQYADVLVLITLSYLGVGLELIEGPEGHEGAPLQVRDEALEEDCIVGCVGSAQGDGGCGGQVPRVTNGGSLLQHTGLQVSTQKNLISYGFIKCLLKKLTSFICRTKGHQLDSS